MPAPELIFVTGASGFLGSHIVTQLLEKGYRVRAAARGSKVDQLKLNYAKYNEQFEAVTISDIASDQFPDALKGVDAVIHSAAPLPERAEPEDMLKGAVQGCLNILHQVEKAGIKRIVITSSIVTVLNPQYSFTDKDWNPMTEEQGLTKKDMYQVAKTLAEREVWAFGESHPELEITTLNPPYLYGPLTESFTLPTPDYYALSTNLNIYRLLSPSGPYPSSPGYADVRNVAKAHILALTSPPTSVVGRKRILFASPYGFDYKETIKTIADKRPELKGRLTEVEVPKFPFDKLPIDFARIEEVLGLGKQDYIEFEDTILSVVDNLLKVEKVWVSKGYTIEIPKA